MNNKFDDLAKIEQNLENAKLAYSKMIEDQEKVLQNTADTMSLLVSSDEDLMARYNVNMAAFEEYYPEIFNFFSTYQPQKYAIKMVDGFVNAYNVETKNYLYAYPSYLETKVQFDVFKKAPNIKKFNFNANVDNEANFIHTHYLDKIIDLFPLKKQSNPNNIKHLSSLIVFGVGAGYHLELISQFYHISCLNIIEPDLDLFFISLFSINWQMVLNNFDRKGTRVFISLGEQEETFFDDFIQQSANNGRYQLSHIAGYIHYQTPELSKLLNEFNRRYAEMGQGWGFFDDAVMSIAHMLGNLNNKVPILHKKAIQENNVADVPVFIVGNGPSLDDLIESIKIYQDKAIIISCGSALSALYQYGIKPDFHCEQERTFPVAEKVTHYCPAEFLKGIVLLAPTILHPEVFNLFSRGMMAAKMNEPSSVLLQNDIEGEKLFTSYHFINPTVANTALVMGYNLGFKNFYLCGIDLGHKQGELHHSKKSIYYNELQEDQELYQVMEEDQIEVDGNFGGKFLCDSFFYQSNASLSKQIRGFSDLHCFNLSDGALVKGSIPTSTNELILFFDDKKILNKTTLVNEVYENSIYEDDNLSLYQRLTNNLDYELFETICSKLISINEQPLNNINEAADLLLMNTDLVRKSNQHINDLIMGSIMHIQVTLTQLLYGACTEEEGLTLFKKGLALYREFLAIAPSYYRENAENPHYINDSKWIVKLRNRNNTAL